jgi:hypothetical protein
MARTTSSGKSRGPAGGNDRRGAALRANLARRKAQARARAELNTTDAEARETALHDERGGATDDSPPKDPPKD